MVGPPSLTHSHRDQFYIEVFQTLFSNDCVELDTIEPAITREGIVNNVAALINLTHDLLADLNIDVEAY